MPINFRGKLAGCKEDMAGNYFNYLVCRPEDCKSPAQIRSAVQEISNDTRVPKSSPMTSWKHMNSRQLFAATSNWTTFCKSLKLKDCQQDVHVPVIPCDSHSAPAMFAGPLKVFKTLKQSGMVGSSVRVL